MLESASSTCTQPNKREREREIVSWIKAFTSYQSKVRRYRRNRFQWGKKSIECIKKAHWRLLSVLIKVKNNFQTFSLGLFVLFGREITERKDAKNVYKLGQGHDITFDKFLTSFLILFPSTVSFFYHSVSFSFF